MKDDIVGTRKQSNKEWKANFSQRLLQFGVKIIKLANKLPKTSAGFVVINQLVKSGTSIGANFQEAQDASSTPDFIHKLSISLREAKETLYWLKIIIAAELLPTQSISEELSECEEIIAVLISSIKSVKLKITNEK